MNYNIRLQELKNTIKVATLTNSVDEIFTKKSTNERDISIKVKYSPFSNPKEDIYPFWEVIMVEEELTNSKLFSGRDIKAVRDVYNGFINQSENESYIENNMLPY